MINFSFFLLGFLMVTLGIYGMNVELEIAGAPFVILGCVMILCTAIDIIIERLRTRGWVF